jgi:hypothetical protein
MVNQAVKTVISGRDPLVWLIYQLPADGVAQLPEDVPCGFVCAAATTRLGIFQPASGAEELEFFVWLHGAYRAMGIGSRVIPSILDDIHMDCFRQGTDPAGNVPRRLTAFFPLQESASGEQLERDRWMGFFFDQGFRRMRQPEMGPGSRMVILKRVIY